MFSVLVDLFNKVNDFNRPSVADLDRRIRARARGEKFCKITKEINSGF